MRISIPDAWPPDVRRRAQQFLALWKYYRASRTLSEAAVPYMERYTSGDITDPRDLLRANALVSYWLSSLQTLSEGWSELQMVDPSVDRLLQVDHRQTLRRYRNAVLHFQKDFEDARFEALESDPSAVSWAFDLSAAFEEYFEPHAEAIDLGRIGTWLFQRASSAG